MFGSIPALLEVTGLNPIDDQFPIHRHGSMLQAFDDREVSVGKVSVLSNHRDVDLFSEGIKVMSHGRPVIEDVGDRTIQVEDITQPLFMEHEWYVVDVWNVVG